MYARPQQRTTAPAIAVLRRRRRLILLAGFAVLAVLAAPAMRAESDDPPTLGFLGVLFENDNASLEPTTDAERVRLERTGEEFQEQLAASGKFKIVSITDAVRAEVERGQMLGECAGCEAELGRKLGVDIVSWLRVQKVSNLILNLNVYMTDVATGKLLLARTVDLRGNTDTSWSRSLRYLVENVVLKADVTPAGN
jgi:hypothetical protein